MNHRRFFCNNASIFVLALIFPLTARPDNTWSYHQENDSLTNQTYSYAQSPLPRPGLYDDIMLEIVCKGNKLQAVKMPSTRIKTKRPQNLYCNLPLNFGPICVA